MKSFMIASLVLAAFASTAVAADSCVSSPDETFAKIVSSRNVDIGELSDLQSDLQTIAQADDSASEEEKSDLRKLARRDRLAVELHVGSARAALTSIKGMTGEKAYGDYVNVVTSALSYYADVFSIAEKYLAGKATSADVNAVQAKLMKNAAALQAKAQAATAGLKRLESGALAKIAETHAKASRIERCKLARTMFAK